MPVIIRPAQAADVPQILSIINRFAEMNVMLPRTEDSVRQTIADWLVAAYDEEPPPGEPVVVGCGALVALTETLVELRSLAVHESQQGKGLGGVLVDALVHAARVQSYTQICALTLRENFFVRHGFSLVDRWAISPKIWQECIYCRKFHRCDEVAVLMELSAERPAAQEAPQAAGAWATLLKWEEWQPLRLAYRQSSAERRKGSAWLKRCLSCRMARSIRALPLAPPQPLWARWSSTHR